MFKKKEYIDKDTLKKYINEYSSHWLTEWSTLGVLAAIDKQPIVYTEKESDDAFRLLSSIRLQLGFSTLAELNDFIKSGGKITKGE